MALAVIFSSSSCDRGGNENERCWLSKETKPVDGQAIGITAPVSRSTEPRAPMARPIHVATQHKRPHDMHSISDGRVSLLSMSGVGGPAYSAAAALRSKRNAAAAADRTDHYYDPSEPKHCRHCSSPSLVVDWAQGDRVCTTCGVIDEEHIRCDGPEWKDYANEDDNGAMFSAAARTGLVPTDETKYLGGLQPTMLSRNPYGGSYGPGRSANGETATTESRIRRKLHSTNRKLEKLMQEKHREQMEEARLARRVMARRRREASQARRIAAAAAEAAGLEDDFGGAVASSSGANPATVSSMSELSYSLDDDLAAIGREHLELAQQEEDAARIDGAAIQADKWSLDRAILLHGTLDEQRPEDTSFHHPVMGQYQHRDIEEERKQLDKKLDANQRAASVDLYRASRILLFAARELELPDRAVNEATAMLCKYAVAKDGFKGVRGISSRSSATDGANKDDPISSSSKKRLAKQRDRNKAQQMTALSSAFIYLSAKKLGHGRSLKDVCSSFLPEHDLYGANHNDKASVLYASGESVIKPKHCSRAMTEIKILFPEYVRSVAACQATNNVSATAGGAANSNSVASESSAAASLSTVFGHRSESEINNLVEGTRRKLNLPPAAITAIGRLSVHCFKEQVQMGHGSSTKPATLCAAMTHLACLAGSSMQNLARQALAPAEEPQLKRKHVRATREVLRSAKKQRLKISDEPTDVVEAQNGTKKIPSSALSVNEKESKPKKSMKKFDMMSHDAIEMDGEVLTETEQETIKVWDMWYSQKSWGRDIGAIAESYSASQAAVTDYYKKHVHYRRKQLLELLHADSISDSADTTLLLKRIAAAAHVI